MKNQFSFTQFISIPMVEFMQSRNERQFAVSFNTKWSNRVDLLLMMSKDHIDNSNVNRPLAEKADNVLRLSYES